MNKIIFFVMIFILIPVYSIAVVPRVQDLYPTYKVYDSINKVWTVPAKIIAKAPSKVVTDSVALGLGKAVAGGIVTSLVIGGVSYLGNSYIDWLMGKGGQEYVLNDKVVKDVHGVTKPHPDMAYFTAYFNNACATNCAFSCAVSVCDATSTQCNPPVGWGTSLNGQVTRDGIIWNVNCVGTNSYNEWTCYRYCQVNTAKEIPTITPTALTRDELNQLHEGAIEGVNEETAPFGDVVNDAIDKAADIVKNGAGQNAASQSVPWWIQKLLDSAITPADSDVINEKLENTEETDQLIDDAVDSGQNKQDMKDAFSESLKDVFGNDVEVPIDPTIQTPNKRNLTAILNSFYNSIQSLPIMSTLNGIAVTASGTSSLCVNLPANYGGNRCWNAANNQADFNMIGSAMLAVVSILSIMFIFRGN